MSPRASRVACHPTLKDTGWLSCHGAARGGGLPVLGAHGPAMLRGRALPRAVPVASGPAATAGLGGTRPPLGRSVHGPYDQRSSTG